MLHFAIGGTRKAPKPRPKAFLGGAGLVWRHQLSLWCIFIVNLALAFAAASGVAHNVADNSGVALNHSLEAAQRFVHGFDVSAIAELNSLPQQPLRGQGFIFVWPPFFFAIFMVFMIGGVLVSYYEDSRMDTGGFFEACGRHFWRFVRLAIYFMIVMIPIFFLASVCSRIYGNIDDASISPYRAPEFAVAAAIVILFLLLAVRLWFDMAQVLSMVAEDRRMYRMLAHAARLVWNNFGSLFWLYLRINVVGWAAFGAGLYIWMMVLRPESIRWAILLSQAMILIWIGTRLWQRAAEAEWYKQYELSLHLLAPVPPIPPAVPAEEALVVPRLRFSFESSVLPASPVHVFEAARLPPADFRFGFGFGFDFAFARLCGAASSQAAAIARRSVVFLTAPSLTLVAPSRPHAPAQGQNAFGSASMNIVCSRGVSLTIPKDLSG